MRAGRYAPEHRKPMLGICKGNPAAQRAHGWLPVSGPFPLRGLTASGTCSLEGGITLPHQIRVEEGTRLSKLLGSGVCMTNSMHHQSVKELGKGLRASAYANDGIIEAIEDQEGLIVGVQWHPESLLESAPAMNHLFSDLCGRALERKAGSL
ncbi:MAG: gamma-glutamyl-gamma-aminobutyrate hydrolase family protein [Enterocloster bolteae]